MLSKGIVTMATTTTMAAARYISIAHKPKWIFTPLSFSSLPSNSNSKPRKLVLYSKPGCCLCDGLKEKLHAAFSLSSPDSLHDVVLQVRDITSNPEWEKAYQYEIPVLAKVLSDNTEEILPRLSPRLGVELVHKKIATAFKQGSKLLTSGITFDDKTGYDDLSVWLRARILSPVTKRKAAYSWIPPTP